MKLIFKSFPVKSLEGFVFASYFHVGSLFLHKMVL